MAQVVLHVPDISCEHCKRTITNVLTPVEGVRGSAVDVPKRQVRVDYDETQVDVEQLGAILQEEDYPVASAEPASQA